MKKRSFKVVIEQNCAEIVMIGVLIVTLWLK